MIHALGYESPGQRFAPRERQRHDEQHKHIHLHLHLHLSFPGRQGRSTHPSAFRMTRILAALVGATVMAISLFFQGIFDSPGTSPFFVIAFFSILAGLALAWCAVVTLLIETWRSTPRVRFLLAVPFVPFLILLFLTLLGMIQGGPSLGTIGAWFGPIQDALFGGTVLKTIWLSCLLYGYAFISTVMFNRAIHRAAVADKWPREAFRLSFVVVSGMVLLFLGGLLWCLTLILVAPGWLQMISPWQSRLSLLGMWVAVIAAVYTLFSWPRDSAQPKQDQAIDYEQRQLQYPEQEPPWPSQG